MLAAGRELGVESVLEGSLQRQGNRVRVTVRLLNVSNGASLWAGTFDEEMTDIFALQDAISERVAQALSLELSKEDKRTSRQALYTKHKSLPALSEGEILLVEELAGRIQEEPRLFSPRS